jgi:hypothetical protein
LAFFSINGVENKSDNAPRSGQMPVSTSCPGIFEVSEGGKYFCVQNFRFLDNRLAKGMVLLKMFV